MYRSEEEALRAENKTLKDEIKELKQKPQKDKSTKKVRSINWKKHIPTSVMCIMIIFFLSCIVYSIRGCVIKDHKAFAICKKKFPNCVGHTIIGPFHTEQGWWARDCWALSSETHELATFRIYNFELEK